MSSEMARLARLIVQADRRIENWRATGRKSEAQQWWETREQLVDIRFNLLRDRWWTTWEAT